MTRLSLLVPIAVSLVASNLTVANPIPDVVGELLRNLPGEIAAEPDTAKERRLVRLLGHYGLGTTTEAEHVCAALQRNFARLAALIVLAQEPPYSPHSDLQRCFGAHATPAQRHDMSVALRRWFLAPEIVPYPWGRGTIHPDPSRVIRLAVWIEAAEALASLGDRESIPSLRAFLESEDMEWLSAQETLPVPAARGRERVQRALAGLTCTRADFFLEPDGDGGIVCYRRIDEVACALIDTGFGANCGNPVVVQIGLDDLSALWPSIEASTISHQQYPPPRLSVRRRLDARTAAAPLSHDCSGRSGAHAPPD